MKKLFSAFTAVLLAFCFISCAPQELSDRSSKNEGSVSLSIRSPRTISPAEGISYKDVEKWTVKFQDITEKYDVITVENVNFNEPSPKEIRLPIGTYNVTLNGTANNPTSGETAQTVHFYGEASVTVKKDEIVPISVFVAPKKSADGTGSFNFTVNISGLEKYPDSTFESKLIPYDGSQELAIEPVDGSQELAIKTASNGELTTLTIEAHDIPSRFYKLSIKFTWVVGRDEEENSLTKTKEIYYPYHDFLVEIVDGCTTTGSVDIAVYLEDSKTYYATTDKDKAKGNGAFESMPGYLDNVLDAVNKTTISEADIHIVDEVSTTGVTIIYPEIEIDVSKVNEKGKRYFIYTKNANQGYSLSYMITGAGGDVGEPTIDIDSSVTTVTLKNSLSSSGISGSAKIVPNGRVYNITLREKTSVIIENPENSIGISIQNSEYNDGYYAQNPCVTVINQTDNSSITVSINEQFKDTHRVVTKTSTSGEDTITDFYIIPTESEYPFSIAEKIPDYSLKATLNGSEVTSDTHLYAGDTVTITATPITEGVTFISGTSFTWFINGKQYDDSTTKSCEITIGAEGNNTEIFNTIICLAEYDGEFATKKKELIAVEQTALLYTRNGIGYSKLALLNENPFVYDILNFDSAAYTYISDFCIDTKTNDAYIIFSDEYNTFIEKATYCHADTTMHYSPEYFQFSGSESNLIRMGNDNTLYVKFNSISDYLVFGIVKLDETAQTVNITQSLIMYEVTSADQIMSFCVDDVGIMYIAYKDSNGIQLAKFSIEDGILTKQNSILLATISATDSTATSKYFTDISSALTVTDMHYEDGYVYLLVRDASAISRSLPKSEVRSLGGVCKIKAEDLTFADAINPLVGWATTTLDTTQNESGENVYNYKHSENEALKEYYFYGPQKIIAIKPKEIVIADDGAYIENSSIKPQNRVVVFNLEKNSITDVKTSPTDFFIGTSLDTYSPTE